jgi:hypothetical protein
MGLAAAGTSAARGPCGYAASARWATVRIACYQPRPHHGTLVARQLLRSSGRALSNHALSGRKRVAREDAASFPDTMRSLRKRDIAGLLGVVAIAGVLAWVAIPSGAPKLKLPGNASSFQGPLFAGATLSPVNAAPDLSLRNYLGDPVNIRGYRGRAVLVTFLYTHCPDVCPLITANLRNALLRMSATEARRRSARRQS